MKKLVIAIGIILIVGHLLTELYMLVWAMDESSATTMLKPFPKDSTEISVLWYIKMFTDELLWCLTYWAFALVAKRYSNVLFSVVMIFFMYHIADFFMYLIAYKNFRWLYILMLAFDVTAVLFLIFQKEKTTKYKSLK